MCMRLQTAIQRRMEDEAIKALEFQASQRMWAMQEEEQRNAIAERLQHEVSGWILIAMNYKFASNW